MISTARNAAKAAAERLYEHRFTVLEATPKKRANGTTEFVFEPVSSGVPCRVSFKTFGGAAKSETASTAPQTVRLYCSPDIRVRPGSRIHVTLSESDIREYVLSGTPAVYPTHQEIELALETERL